jgi:hypothetical protein
MGGFMRNTSKLAVVILFSITFGSPYAFAQIDCPIEGTSKPGGRPLTPDKIQLNKYKNRTLYPIFTSQKTVDDILALPKADDPSLDNTGVVLEGYLLNFKQEGPESPNCYDPDLHDFHMWIGKTTARTPKARNALRRKAVVVEPTPRTQALNPSWTKANLNKIRGQRVRITGWLMYDFEHPPQVGKTRGTLWEVHPVMKIEVLQGGQWVQF